MALDLLWKEARLWIDCMIRAWREGIELMHDVEIWLVLCLGIYESDPR